MEGEVQGRPPQYNLPGVMHYLQSEFSKNEKDRTLWLAQRSEMEARIAHLEGENKSLREQNEILSRQKRKALSSSSSSSKSSLLTGNPPNIDKFKLDLNPLREAKEKLQKNMHEISYLLSSQPLNSSDVQDLDHVEPLFKKDVGFEPNAASIKSDTFDSLNYLMSPSSEPEPNIPINGLSLAPPDNSFDPITREPDEISDSTDAETIMGSEAGEEEQLQEREQKKNNTHKHDKDNNDSLAVNATKFDTQVSTVIKSPAGRIVACSFNESTNELLTLSTDNVVRLWGSFSPGSKLSPKVVSTFQGESSNIKNLKWINDSLYWTQTDDSIKIWQKNDSKVKHKIDRKNVEYVESSGEVLLVKWNSSYFLYKILENQIPLVTYKELHDLRIFDIVKLYDPKNGKDAKRKLVAANTQKVVFDFEGEKKVISLQKLPIHGKIDSLTILSHEHFLIHSNDAFYYYDGDFHNLDLSVFAKMAPYKDCVVWTNRDGEVEIRSFANGNGDLLAKISYFNKEDTEKNQFDPFVELNFKYLIVGGSANGTLKLFSHPFGQKADAI